MQEWLDILNDAGVPCGPIYNVDQIFKDPQVLARDMLVEIDHPKCGKIQVTGSPIKLSETPAEIKTHPPMLGEHNSSILQECGFSEEDITKLKEDKVI
jgi:CoA:oxalate CoA-transferase